MLRIASTSPNRFSEECELCEAFAEDEELGRNMKKKYELAQGIIQEQTIKE